MGVICVRHVHNGSQEQQYLNLSHKMNPLNYLLLFLVAFCEFQSGISTNRRPLPAKEKGKPLLKLGNFATRILSQKLAHKFTIFHDAI